jgi:hypothetical protein
MTTVGVSFAPSAPFCGHEIPRGLGGLLTTAVQKAQKTSSSDRLPFVLFEPFVAFPLRNMKINP